MSRWRELSEVEAIREMSAAEIRSALDTCRRGINRLNGPAVKLMQKRIHKLERALALKLSAQNQTARD